MTRLNGLLLIFIIGLAACQNARKEQQIPRTETQSQDGEFTLFKGAFNVSGVYPHLTTYSHARTNEVHSYTGIRDRSQRECGIGALAVWNDKLYMVNYAAHEPYGSEHKLYIVDENLDMKVFQKSVGGTPAARMVHQESNQLLIGHYVVDSAGNIRVISIEDMPGRMTAIARHLKDPEKKVYYYDMEGMLYDVNVHTLEPELLYKNPLPGWHGKGAYTSQGKLVLANNGEHTGAYEPTEYWKVDSQGMFGPDKNGVLAEYDGEEFSIVERKQFTDVTTKHGIDAAPDDDGPLWAIGWDKKSLRLKVMEGGQWTTYLLPKATYNNDPTHGWFTEWPRIRELFDDQYMMDMHGTFFDFPATFSHDNSAGISPIGSHLRYVPDFLGWNGQVILATDETSIQGNPLAGQPQSNLWFGSFEELSEWGPANGYGSVWMEEEVKPGAPTLPYLFNGYQRRMLHLSNQGEQSTSIQIEIDKQGRGEWQSLMNIDLDAGEYVYHIFKPGVTAQWIRLSSSQSTKMTATFHYTEERTRQKNQDNQLFRGLARADKDAELLYGRLYSNHDNFNLSYHKGKVEEDTFERVATFELDKYHFQFEKGLKDSTSLKAMDHHVIWKEDDASVILEAEDKVFRLPKTKGEYNSSVIRNEREVQSERLLANIYGTFYEIPFFKVGEPPLYEMMRPVATHQRKIIDFNTWNGLLVMTGVKKTSKPSKHVLKNETNDAGVWIGGIDDIWKFGKPVGEGGPWKDTEVREGELSDPYLMKGYDSKTLKLLADKDVEVSLFIHHTHYSEKADLFKTFKLKAGEEKEYHFPEGFSAHWVQLKAGKDCKATAWFTYE